MPLYFKIEDPRHDGRTFYYPSRTEKTCIDELFNSSTPPKDVTVTEIPEWHPDYTIAQERINGAMYKLLRAAARHRSRRR